MHLPEANIVIAIYGPSCTGKTTLAKEIGKRWAVQVRHCGDALKARAAELGIALEKLPVEVHRTIDAETQSLARNARGTSIIEGRYLDLVLAGITHTKFVRLVCDQTVREQRFHAKANRQIAAITTIPQHDQEDARLRRILYSDSFPTTRDWLVLDTTRLAPEELISTLLSRMQQEMYHDEAQSYSPLSCNDS